MNELYNIGSTFVSSTLLLALGLMLIFFASADNPRLGNYRRARRALGIAYLFFAPLNVVEYLFAGPTPDMPLMRTITLAIAAAQALMFTLAILAMLETRHPGWRPIVREASPALLLIAAVFTVYTACSEACFDVAFWIFAGVYALLLVRYTALFVRNYRRFRRRMDNNFSGNEADRLRWVAFSFYAALAIGVMALITSVFVSTAVAFCFTVVYDIFYVYFAIRFINYAHRFHDIEEAMEDDTSDGIVSQDDNMAVTAAGGKTAVRFAELERRIEQWVADKGYTDKNVTAKMLVPRFCTNSRYLSAYINTRKGKTFNRWINELRVGEAQRLMCEHPDMNVIEIARQVGFPDKSNFIRQFTSIVGHSPSNWRRQTLKTKDFHV